MAFDWSNLGQPAGPDEVEVSLIGPGFGECVLVHVGGGRWLTVDSCVDPTDKADRRPVAERYLRAMGVQLESQVELILASHWHADHVRGLGRLVELCPNAVFSCSQALTSTEFQIFVEEMSTASAATDGAKLRDFREAIRHIRARDQVIRFSVAGKTLKSWPSSSLAHQEPCLVRALSPSDKESNLFLQEIARQSPSALTPKRAATASSPNLVSVVLHVQFGSFAVLLGADMETHHDPQRGWTAVVTEGRNLQALPSSLLKVPHHGSLTGHHGEMWSHLLEPKPVGIVSPFNSLPASRRLPTERDVARLVPLTTGLYSSAMTHAGGVRGREPAVERSLRESAIQMRDLESPIGLVRCRKRPGQQWTVQTFSERPAIPPSRLTLQP